MFEMATQPAFTTVAARKTIPPKSASAQFPPGVVDYVQRAFFEFNRVKDTPAFHGITDADIRAELATVVNQGTQDALLHSRDWSTFPLPHQIIVDRHHRAALYVAQNARLASKPLVQNGYAPPIMSCEQDATPKKRKSPDSEYYYPATETQSVTPPWKKTATPKSISIDRTFGKSKIVDSRPKTTEKPRVNSFDFSDDAKARRRQRFGDLPLEPVPMNYVRDAQAALQADTGPIVGTCETLEKNYFRLTAPPNPSTVRPLRVLERALDLVISKWKTDHEYTYFCDQMKSMRQDLTVQRIKTEFTIRVYELHARIALERKDLGEYNQCQTQLRGLYKLRLGENGSAGGNPDEFLAYRILYLLYTCNRTDMNNMLADLTPADKKGRFVQHALKVRSALASGNYHKFFTLYAESQEARWNMVPYLLDMFVERERVSALAVICKAYKPDIAIGDLARELAFDCDVGESFFSEDVARLCYEFIHKYNGDDLVVRKDDSTRFLTGKAGALFEQAKKNAFSKVDIKGQI